ncbi:hypothetical protein LHP98_13295 [Rhodobacter sp. Har01]|uniref:hypothetical protein n=1 Tax=Rhodobacter sp. Har01 TaxID=2883999 RepID=UPI001D087D7C|nr:hypothetical protein [Rhodobacter sp. Har01]MCB6179094.1 hypothetical protein [Rhodobacter sp. Har01]
MTAAPAAAPFAPVAARAGWTRYLNPRFGAGIDYDASLFLLQPASENGESQAFGTADGRL